MELIHQYREFAYKNHFDCEYMWLNLNKDRANIDKYLEEKQKGESIKYRFKISDIDEVFKDKNFDNVENGFISKVVIQKANFDVQQSTKNNGCTTRLLFLVKAKNSWYLYGCAKGRYNSWSMFDIDEKGMLGYTFYISLIEKDEQWSAKLSDDRFAKRSISRIRELLKNRTC